MKTIKIYIGVFAILISFFAAGCGSVSAPPVDLPAPITGRVDVSSPDADGNVTITGSEGAVEGGYIVMVVNESVATAWKLLDKLIPSAYAQTLPTICSAIGHACTVAAADGSFQVVIAASINDTLVIGLIDENGDWISEVIRVLVPESGTPDPSANCVGRGVTGTVVDVKIAPTSGVPVLLKQGSDATTNELVIGTSNPATVAITGCYAHSLAFYATSSGDAIVVTSKDDRVLWAARMVGNDVRDTRSFTLDYEPMHIAFVNLPTQPVIAIRKTASTIALAGISTSEGTIALEMDSGATGVTRSTALDALPMENNAGQYLGMLVVDDGTHIGASITLFEADTLSNKGSFSRDVISQYNQGFPLDSITDALLYRVQSGGTNDYYLNLAILDSSSTVNILKKYSIWYTTSTNERLLRSVDLASVTTFLPPTHSIWHTEAGAALNNITRGTFMTTGDMAIMTEADGKLFEQELWTDNDILYLHDWAPGDSIVALDALPGSHELYGADATAGTAINGSSYVTW
jgi:hypothetical protein